MRGSVTYLSLFLMLSFSLRTTYWLQEEGLTLSEVKHNQFVLHLVFLGGFKAFLRIWILSSKPCNILTLNYLWYKPSATTTAPFYFGGSHAAIG